MRGLIAARTAVMTAVAAIDADIRRTHDKSLRSLPPAHDHPRRRPIDRARLCCPGGKELRKYHRAFAKLRDGLTKDGTVIYFARKQDCHACALKPQCCPNVPARKIARSVHEAARDKARAIAKTEAYALSCRERKKVEMLFAHLKRILRLGRLRLRGPNGAKDEFLLAATAQNLRKLAKLIPLPAPIFAT
jgi:Transposase DDE domain